MGPLFLFSVIYRNGFDIHTPFYRESLYNIFNTMIASGSLLEGPVNEEVHMYLPILI